MIRRGSIVAVGWLSALLLATGAASGQDVSGSYLAVDTLDPPAAATDAAAKVIEAVRWTPGTFLVEVQARPEQDDADALVRFPTAKPSGVAAIDTVPIYWYAARDEAGRVIEAPAVLVVHSLHPQMLVGRAIARGLAAEGMHAFVVTLPGFGQRVRQPRAPVGVTLLERAGQAVADVRRARDAIDALPHVAEGPIALQGTSLGGFVATVAGALDGAFEPVMLLLSGADGYHVIQTGERDAAVVRRSLARAGYEDERLRAMLDRIEPAHVAHRLDAETTWLFSARADTVVPRASTEALVAAVGLEASHHVELAGDHYTSVLVLPGVVEAMSRLVRGEPIAPVGEVVTDGDPAPAGEAHGG